MGLLGVVEKGLEGRCWGLCRTGGMGGVEG